MLLSARTETPVLPELPLALAPTVLPLTMYWLSDELVARLLTPSMPTVLCAWVLPEAL
ncbi:hypothetical protein D3C72_1335340 [compost metagenome]